MKILDMLRGITGEFEITRVVGAFGAVTYIISAPTFQAWEILYNGRPFDITAFCLAFPAGLGVSVGAIAGAASLKDRNTATATVVRETGAMPTTQATGPQDVHVINRPDQPVPTTTEETR